MFDLLTMSKIKMTTSKIKMTIVSNDGVGWIIWCIIRFSDCTWGTLKSLQVRVVRQALSGNVFRIIASLIFPTTMKVFGNQDVGAHSCMVRKILFSSFEVPTMEFRGLQDLFLPFRNDNFIQNIAQSGLSKFVQTKYIRE